MKRIMLPLAAAALTLAAALPTTAAAAPKAKPALDAEIISHVKTHDGGNTATVKARYRCAAGFHLWVSAKQAASRKRDAALEGEGSSRFAAAWLQNHPDLSEFTCNGKWKTGTFEIHNQVEEDFGFGGFGRFERGLAWVQFCLVVDEVTTLSENEWVKVN